jgi:hypothetical protein
MHQAAARPQAINPVTKPQSPAEMTFQNLYDVLRADRVTGLQPLVRFGAEAAQHKVACRICRCCSQQCGQSQPLGIETFCIISKLSDRADCGSSSNAPTPGVTQRGRPCAVPCPGPLNHAIMTTGAMSGAQARVSGPLMRVRQESCSLPRCAAFACTKLPRDRLNAFMNA